MKNNLATRIILSSYCNAVLIVVREVGGVESTYAKISLGCPMFSI